MPTAAAVPKGKRESPFGKVAKWAIAGGGIAAVAVVAAVLMLPRSEAKPAASEPAAIVVKHEPPPPDPVDKTVRPFFEKHCLDCHGADSPEGDLDLATDLAEDPQAVRSAIAANRHQWEHAYNMIRIGAMPPADMDPVSVDEKDAIVAWLDGQLYHVDCEANPTPGRVTARRLNRAEYNNTVRDLLGVGVTPADDFPSDEVGYGFDNIGDVLSMPPLLVEKYLDAAEEVARAAIPTGDPDLRMESRTGSQLRRHNAGTTGNHAMLGSNGARAQWDGIHFRRDGEYEIAVILGSTRIPKEGPAKVDIHLGEEKLASFTIDVPEGEFATFRRRLFVKASRQSLKVTFTNDMYRPTGKYSGDRNAIVVGAEVQGPYGVSGDGGSAVVRVRPGQTVDGITLDTAEAARRNLAPLLERAFRRPVPPAEVDRIAGFCGLMVEQGGSFEEGMQASLQAMLISPRFLFRIEEDDGRYGRIARELSDWELASRLSYFLWTTMPDERLFDLARENRLSKPDVLRAEVNRMLADPRADAMLASFAGQWLGLRQLPEQSVDPKAFPRFDARLLDDMASETEQLVRYAVRENRPVGELLTADYTFVNERLAKHYGIPDVAGDHFRRVELSAIPSESGARRGLLTHASVLSLTSYPNRTSPVRRGEWILTNILGDEPPPPPPNVPALDETQASSPDLPLRKQLELHRADPTCASCHVVMDELGFGFENFDAIGRYRTKDGKHEVDAAGVLPGGQSFDGATELIAILEQREEEFVRTFVERLLTFALGRGVDYRDQCVVDQIVHATAEGEHRLQDVVRQVVLSRAFTNQGPDPNLLAGR